MFTVLSTAVLVLMYTCSYVSFKAVATVAVVCNSK